MKSSWPNLNRLAITERWARNQKNFAVLKANFTPGAASTQNRDKSKNRRSELPKKLGKNSTIIGNNLSFFSMNLTIVTARSNRELSQGVIVNRCTSPTRRRTAGHTRTTGAGARFRALLTGFPFHIRFVSAVVFYVSHAFTFAPVAAANQRLFASISAIVRHL
jgi:hypothetical protein